MSPILNILKEGAPATFQQPQQQQDYDQTQQQQSSVTISPAYQSLGITGTAVPALPIIQMTNTRDSRPDQMQVDQSNVDVLAGAPGTNGGELPPVDTRTQGEGESGAGGHPVAAAGFDTSGIGRAAGVTDPVAALANRMMENRQNLGKPLKLFMQYFCNINVNICPEEPESDPDDGFGIFDESPKPKRTLKSKTRNESKKEI